ncbi:MAG: histidinol-phosphate transaminase [Pseudomonadota bacterium]
MIRARKHIAAMAPYGLADLQPPVGKRLISLAQNESALPPSPAALEAAAGALTDSALYPDPDWADLRQEISKVHELEPAHILCGAGSMELILCLTQCYAGHGDEVLSSQYAYAFFQTAAAIAQATYVTAPEEKFTVSVDGLLDAVTSRTRVVLVANPGNPTGTRIGKEELVRLRRGLREDVLLVIDEAYGEFADGEDEPVFDLTGQGNTVVLRTFSKAYALAGMRVGWGVFPPQIAAEVRKVLNPNDVSAVSQAACAAAMVDQDWMRKACHTVSERRDRFAGSVRQLGLSVPESSTNFILINFASPDAATAADHALRAEGVFMRSMKGYGLPASLRATIGAEDDMQFALDVLSGSCLEEGG